METPTTGFVIDMIRNRASLAIGFLASRSIRPCASKCTMRPRRATSVTAPAKFSSSMFRCISSWILCRRSDEKPESSGFTCGIVWADAIEARPISRINSRIRDDLTVRFMAFSIRSYNRTD